MDASKGHITCVFLSLVVFHWFHTLLLFSDSSFGFSPQRTRFTKVASSDKSVKMGSSLSSLHQVDHENQKQSTTSIGEFDSGRDFQSLSVAMKDALDELTQTGNISRDVLSAEFASALKESPKQEFDEQNDTFFLIRNDAVIMKGVPRRPFYKEIIKRILKIEEYYGGKG